MTVIDGDGAILGRLATNVAKRTLKGEYVDIVNAREIIITGNKKLIFSKYKTRRDLTCNTNPDRGMKFPRTPEGIVKWAVRGMVGHKTARGRKALKYLKIHRGIPEALSKSKLVKIKDAIKEPEKAYTTVGDVSKFLGFER